MRLCKRVACSRRSIDLGPIALVLFLHSSGCMQQDAPALLDPIETNAIAVQSGAAQTGVEPDYRSLCCGTAETIVSGIQAAEDVMFSSDARLFVTGNEGIFELQRDAAGAVQAINLHPGETCVFVGIVEIGDTIYAACDDYTNSYLFAGTLPAAPGVPTFTQIFAMNGVPLANEMAADKEGRIYVASSLQGTILRLTLAPSDPFTVSGIETWLSTLTGILPNGLKYVNSTVYWTDSLSGSVGSVRVMTDGSPGVFSEMIDPGQFFDDLYVNLDGNIVVASYLAGTLRAYRPFAGVGAPYAQTRAAAFTNPADVVPALGRLGFSDTDLIVADKGANSVVAFHLPF